MRGGESFPRSPAKILWVRIRRVIMNIEMNDGGQKYVCPTVEIVKIAIDENICSSQGVFDNGINCDPYEDGEEF